MKMELGADYVIDNDTITIKLDTIRRGIDYYNSLAEQQTDPLMRAKYLGMFDVYVGLYQMFEEET